ncbi:MAG: ribbon-helix-helix domain-containing protein [Iamia sp.]
MTIQIAVKLSDEVVETVDALVQAGSFRSRSDAVRRGLDLAVERAQSAEIDHAFTEGFTRFPDRPDEVAAARRLAVEAIEAEPWDRWW